VRALTPVRRASPATMLRIARDFTVAACATQYLNVYRKALSLYR
jgi:hypothetical protein